MTDEVRRTDDPAAGGRITAQPRDTDLLIRADGRIAEVQRFFVNINFPDGHPWTVGDEVILAFGPDEYRFAALAKVKGETPDGTRFMRQSPWRPLNTRAFPRFAVEVSVSVNCGDTELAGMTTNLSFGGAALALQGLPEGDVVTVRLGELEPIEAKVVTSGTEAGDPARIEFVEPTDEQLWDIESLILVQEPGIPRQAKRAS